MSWKSSVCQTSIQIKISDINYYITVSPPIKKSPIDRYYAATEDLLTKISPSYFSTYSPEISSLLYIGLISAVENYFRDILGFILSMCPIAREKAAEEKVQLGSFLWGGSELHNRTAFDFIAFSSSKNISDTINKFSGYQIKPKGVWYSLLKEYDKLCEIRHGIVHSGHVLSGKNALKLGLSPTLSIMKTNPSYATLQEAGSICTTLVQAANNELFEIMVDRWATEWRKMPSWDKKMESKILKKIYSGFLSYIDLSRSAVTNACTFSTFIRRVKKEYNL